MDELANSASTQPRRPFPGLIGSTQRHGLDAFVNSAGHTWQQRAVRCIWPPSGPWRKGGETQVCTEGGVVPFVRILTVPFPMTHA